MVTPFGLVPYRQPARSRRRNRGLTPIKFFHFFPNGPVLHFFAMKETPKVVETEGLDLATFGQRLRHARRARGMTLADLGASVGRTPSVLSLIENGKREPRLTLVEQLATALGVPVGELLKKQPPSRRAQLESALEQAQRAPSSGGLGLPPLRVGTRVPTEILEHLVALATELRAQ